jgi:SAM-dependent methyltransferase
LDAAVARSLLKPFVKDDRAAPRTFAELRARITPILANQLAYNLSIVKRGQRIFDLVSRHMTIKDGMNVLDIGAGFGGMLLPFGRHGFELHGIELDPVRRKMCDQTLATLGYKATFYDVDLCRQAIDAQFDVIVCNSVIEHVFNPDAMLARMGSMLRESGVLVLGVANKDAIGNVIADPHYGTFGLTILPNGLARLFYEAVEPKPQRYSVTDFYSIENYIHQLSTLAGPVEAIPGEESRTIADFPSLFGRLGAGYAAIVGRVSDPLLLRQFNLAFADYASSLAARYAEALERGLNKEFEDRYIHKSFHLIAKKVAGRSFGFGGKA